MDKPLHVRVAEVLGWRGFASLGPLWFGYDPFIQMDVEVPRYDTDWSATGPLIEKYRLEVTRECGEWCAHWSGDTEYIKVHHDDGTHGKTLLIAVCNLILALAEAGKLEAA